MHFRRACGLLAAVATAPQLASAGITVNVQDQSSLKSAAKQVAANMMTFYVGNQPGQTPGILPPPYYWWEAGAMFGQLINYWNLTGDSTYNDIVMQAMQFQVGDNDNYMPDNQTKDLGNDDQVFWAFSAMDAAESNFPNPPSQQPSWLALAQAVFNTQITRWDTANCGGGLRWQIYSFNAGYDYKNTISTGGLFQLSARLARYTGNTTYSDWAEKTWDWLAGTPIFNKAQNGSWDGDVWDGVYIVNQCSAATQTFWTYNVGTLLSGAAYMYNYTNGSSTWSDRVNSLMQGTNVFFVQSAGANNPPQQAPAGGQILAEVACEFPATQTCNYDEPSFKSYLLRWMAVTTQLVPWTQKVIYPRLQASADAAAGQCSGTVNNLQNMCGRRWYQNTWDGMSGVGEQMSALSVFQNNLIGSAAPPLTSYQGGTSQGNPAAGTQGSSNSNPLLSSVVTKPISTSDKAGAAILTTLALLLVIAGTWWMLI